MSFLCFLKGCDIIVSSRFWISVDENINYLQCKRCKASGREKYKADVLLDYTINIKRRINESIQKETM